MREVPLGEVILPAKDPVRLDDATEYPTVGILNYGRGLFERPIVRGHEVSYSTYFRIAADQFIYSKLFAWEGALTVVPARLDGYFVSQEFPTFDVDRSQAIPEYLRLLTTWPELWARVRAGESGMGGRRKRVHPEKLLSTLVPLPEPQAQMRIASLVTALDRSVRASEALETLATAALRAYECDYFAMASDVELRAVTSFASGYGFSPAEQGHSAGPVPFFKVSDMNRPGNEITMRTAANYVDAEALAGLKAKTWPEGTVVFPKVGAALLTEKRRVLGRESAFDNNMMGLVPGPDVRSAFLLSFMRTVRLGDLSQSGAVPSINQSHVGDLKVSVPTLGEQDAYIDRLTAFEELTTAALSDLHALRRTRSAILDDLLTGAHEIPASYDELLERAS